jgi:hypothetical protein
VAEEEVDLERILIKDKILGRKISSRPQREMEVQ